MYIHYYYYCIQTQKHVFILTFSFPNILNFKKYLINKEYYVIIIPKKNNSQLIILWISYNYLKNSIFITIIK